MSYHIGLQVLRAKIRGLYATGLSLQKEITKTYSDPFAGPRRQQLRQQKRSLGVYTREHLIAYGLLRGIPYEYIERCSANNLPNVKRVNELIKQHSAFNDGSISLSVPGTTPGLPLVRRVKPATAPYGVPSNRRDFSKETPVRLPFQAKSEGLLRKLADALGFTRRDA